MYVVIYLLIDNVDNVTADNIFDDTKFDFTLIIVLRLIITSSGRFICNYYSTIYAIYIHLCNILHSSAAMIVCDISHQAND